ncbi:hypothetical protein Tco_1035422, partial [Tanacetum coccineum]
VITSLDIPFFSSDSSSGSFSDSDSDSYDYSFESFSENLIAFLSGQEEKRESLTYNTLFLGEYECSSLALDGGRRERLDHLNNIKQVSDQSVYRKERERATSPGDGLTVPDISEGRESGKEFGFDPKEDEVVPRVEDVSLVDGIFDGALGGDGVEDFARGYGFELLWRVDEEALLEAIEEEEECDEDDEENKEDDHYLIKRKVAGARRKMANCTETKEKAV